MFCEVFCSLWRSARFCCICIKIGKGIFAIHLMDVIECIINGLLISLYLQNTQWITFMPYVLILFGNILPLFLRIIGLLLRICGLMRVWTRGAVFCSRLMSIIFMLVILMFQVMVTYFVLH